MVKQQAKLLVNGKPLILKSKRPAVDKIIKFLDASKDNEVWTLNELVSRVGVGKRTIDNLVIEEKYSGYFYKLPNHLGGYHCGNKNAIKLLIEQLKDHLSDES